MKKSLCLLCLACYIRCTTAAPFQNLGFDDANTNNLIISTPSLAIGYTSNLLVGWSASFEPTIGLDTFAAGLGYKTIVSTNGSHPFNNLPEPGYPVSGPYHLLLVPFRDFTTSQFVPDSITQIGDVPADANSIHFFTYGSQFELQVNGSLMPLFYNYLPGSIDPHLNPANVYADISAFAGQTVAMSFITIENLSSYANYYGLDGIFFSPEAVPEPGAFGLLTLGSLLLGWWFRRRRT